MAAPIALSCLTEPASGLVLGWQPSPDPSVVSYAVLYGTNSGSYTTRIEVGNQTNATIELPKNAATWYFAVIACTLDGMESLPSNEVSYEPPAELSKLLILQTADRRNQSMRFSVGSNQVCQLQVSEDVVDWRTLWQITALADGWIDVVGPVAPFGPTQFYRLVSAPQDLATQLSYLPPGVLVISRNADAPNAQIRFAIGPAGHWLLEGSEDLVHWTNLYEVSALAEGWVDVFDPIVPYRSTRFYRLESAPTVGGDMLEWLTGNKNSGRSLSATEAALE